MKIALVQARLSEANTFIQPLGILYIASYLQQQGHTVLALDVDPDVDNPILRLVDFSPDIIGFSLMTTYYRKTDKLIRHLKKHFPKSLICAGGIHPSALPERTVRELGGGIDFVVVGEGELVMAEVANNIEAGLDYQHVTGTVHLIDQKIIHNGRAAVCHDLDSLPFPARDLMDMRKYLTPPGPIKGISLSRTANLITGRGCPGTCIFCGNQILFERGLRRRSVENVITEIEELVNTYNLNGFNFIDDTFTLNPNWIKEFCHKLIEKNWNLKWVCNARANTITDELVQLMYKAGCRQYEIGVESGSDRILKLIKKGLTSEQIAKGHEIAKRNGMRRTASFMINFPTETEEDIQMTARLAKRIKPDFVSFFFLTPYPGTGLYHMAIENGWIPKKPDFGEEWSIRQAEEPVMAIEFTPQKLKTLRAKLQNQFFIKNFLSNINLPFMLLMGWSLLSTPKELFRSMGLMLRTGRLDYLAEGALKAYRYKVERPKKHYCHFRVLTTNKNLRHVWGEPVKTTEVQTRILSQKKLLLHWYRKIYKYMAENISKETVNVEIGSGSSKLYEYISGLIRSNILFIKENDITFSAYEIPFRNTSVGNIILIDVLHHLHNPYAFFREAQRVLRPGGRILICDPYLSMLSYPIWKYLHHENCDCKHLGFNNQGNINPLIDANSANASILFSSNKNPFSKICYHLTVKKINLHSKFHYWIVGGYNFPQFLPTVFSPLVNLMERVLAPFDKWLASFMFVVIEKKKENCV